MQYVVIVKTDFNDIHTTNITTTYGFYLTNLLLQSYFRLDFVCQKSAYKNFGIAGAEFFYIPS